nr:MAG TPA: hypothetical protein [Bacteriophage sp.]
MVRCKTSYIALVTFLIMFSISFIKKHPFQELYYSKKRCLLYVFFVNSCLKNCVSDAIFD